MSGLGPYARALGPSMGLTAKRRRIATSAIPPPSRPVRIPHPELRFKVCWHAFEECFVGRLAGFALRERLPRRVWHGKLGYLVRVLHESADGRRRRRRNRTVPVRAPSVLSLCRIQARWLRVRAAGSAQGAGGLLSLLLLLPWSWAQSVYCPGCLTSLARAGGHAGRVSVVVSELGRPFNDQAAATYFFGFVSSPCGKRTRKTRCHCCSPSQVTVRWSTRSPGVGLGWLFAIWSGTPPRNPLCWPGDDPVCLAKRELVRRHEVVYEEQLQ